jgi:hypothetical protein
MFAPPARAKRLQWKIALMFIMYLGIICAVQQISICLLILIRIQMYIINTYITLMDRVNSMVMVEKLKRTLAEELRRHRSKFIRLNKSTSVGTKNQVESFLVYLS